MRTFAEPTRPADPPGPAARTPVPPPRTGLPARAPGGDLAQVPVTASPSIDTGSPTESPNGAVAVPPIARRALGEPGQPVDRPRGGGRAPAIRPPSAGTDLETDARAAARTAPSHGPPTDLAAIRVHTGPQAAATARMLGARAFTVGRDIVFGPGRYAPGTPAGDRLLAHELHHVGQQARLGERLQCDDEPLGRSRTTIPVRIPRGVTSPEEFRRYAETVIFGKVVGKPWQANPGATAVYTDITKHVGETVTFTVDAAELARHGRADDPAAVAERRADDQAYSGTTGGNRDQLNTEIDRRFYAGEQVAPGTKIGAAETGRVALWNDYKRKVMADRRRLDALPPEIRRLLLDDNAVASVPPADFEQVLRIISTVSTLTAAEVAEYRSRVTATGDWNTVEASLQRFVAERRERNATAEQRNTMDNRLFTLEALYTRYADYKRLQGQNLGMAGLALGAAGGGGGGGDLGLTTLGTQMSIDRTRAELDKDLVTAGFPRGLVDFEKLVHDYERAFESDTLALATVMLDQYAHVLWTQERAYANQAATDALFDALHKTTARADFEQAETIRDEHAQTPWTPGEMAEQSYWVGKRNASLAHGEREVRALAPEHPLLGEEDFPRQELARAATKGEVRRVVLGYIADRRKNIAETRAELRHKPGMIYSDGLDVLIQASFESQHIRPGSVGDRIVRDHIRDVHWTEAIPQIVLAVVAIAAGLLTAGTGTVAVLAGGVALGIGAYQAVEEFRRYERKTAAHGAGLLSDDPSMAWVIVAVVGAGLDAAGLAGAIGLRGPLTAFNAGAEAGDTAALAAKLGTIKLDPKVQAAILRAAEAEVDARKAWRAILGSGGKAMAVPSLEALMAVYFGRFVRAVYMSARRGIRQLEVFARSSEAIELIGDVGKLSVEEIAALKAGYLKALAEADALAVHGKTLGMADQEVLAFMNLRGKTAGMNMEQVTAEMDAWKAVKSSGLPFGFETAEKFDAFRAAAAKGLRKSGYSDGEAILQGSAASGISYQKQLPFGAGSDLDVSVVSRSAFEKARKLHYEVKNGPMRIGPLEGGQIKELGLDPMVGSLSEAAGGREVNIMLFSNRGATGHFAGVPTPSVPLGKPPTP